MFVEQKQHLSINAKRIALSLLSLGIAFILLMVSVFSLNNPGLAVSDEIMAEIKADLTMEDDSTASGEPAEATTAAMVSEKEYLLPYPGILPDHPLYWLKMIRDRVWLWFTRDPVLKAERFILYADKRLGAGEALIKGNKQNLGVTTITKGEKYLNRAYEEYRSLSGEARNEVQNKIRQSTSYHQRTLESLQDKVPESLRQPWYDSRQLNQSILEKL